MHIPCTGVPGLCLSLFYLPIWPVSGPVFHVSQQHPEAEAALPRPLISAAVILRPPAAVLLLLNPVAVILRPAREVGGVDQRLKTHTAARTRKYLGLPRGRTTVQPAAAPDLPAPSSHLLCCFVVCFDASCVYCIIVIVQYCTAIGSVIFRNNMM